MATERKFSKRSLVHPQLGSALPPSMPLVIPNDQEYDFSSNELRPIAGERRSSLKIVPETLQLLEGVLGPVGMLAIGGPCRTGKSYVLSRMLGSGDAFALGHTMDPKTFGIWIGTTVLECDEFTLFLMDTEGIDAAHARTKDDASVLVMTVLLSSYFIYNSVGVPRHNDLQKMSHFAKLATSIAVRSGASNDEEDDDDSFDLKDHFPDFLWLLRDVILTPTDKDGKEITPKEYLLTNILKRSKKFKETANDEISRAIITVFPTIDCKSIPPPSVDPKVMRSVEENQDRLSPEFNLQVEKLVEFLFQHVQGKRGPFPGKVVTGPILADMADQYLKAINDPDALPCINDTWQAAIEIRCQKEVELLLTQYESEMEEAISKVGLPMEEDSVDDKDAKKPQTLFGIHRMILGQKVNTLIKQIAPFVPGASQLVEGSVPVLNREKLIETFEQSTAEFVTVEETILGKTVQKKQVTGGILLKFAQQNHSESRSSCLALFQQQYEPIEVKIKEADTSYTFDKLVVDLAKLQSGYIEKAVGPAKHVVYEEKQSFIKRQEESYQSLRGFKKEAFEEAQKAAAATAKAAELNDTVNNLQIQMKNDAELHLQKMEQLEKKRKEDLDNMHKEQQQMLDRERDRADNFMKAQMEGMSEMAKANQKQSKQQFTAMMAMMNTMSETNKGSIEALKSTVQEMRNIKPPQPVVVSRCVIS